MSERRREAKAGATFFLFHAPLYYLKERSHPGAFFPLDK